MCIILNKKKIFLYFAAPSDHNSKFNISLIVKILKRLKEEKNGLLS